MDGVMGLKVILILLPVIWRGQYAMTFMEAPVFAEGIAKISVKRYNYYFLGIP
jgi:hypothetical protein